MRAMLSAKEIKRLILKKKGIITASSARVFRQSYFGNDIIAPNSDPTPDKTDWRGYAPVELWIMSIVEADNQVRMPGEGITKVLIDSEKIPLTQIKDLLGEFVFGSYINHWPLTKILDIGGRTTRTSFGTKEIPPIPAHVHGGKISKGKVLKPGKSEAYFFPPTNLEPYNKKISAKTRIGLKPKVKKEDIRKKLKEFGKNDLMYTLLNEFKIRPMTGWTVPQGIIHAPGPYLTFEIQLPQDDYNLASWRLGERLEEQERNRRYGELVLRGLKNEGVFVELLLDWPANTDKDFEKKYFREPKVIESGSWGRRLQIFFDQFYGEGWELFPGQTKTLPVKNVPVAGVVWSGQAAINDSRLEQGGQNEFLAIPDTKITVTNPGILPLFIYTVEPIKNQTS